MWSIVTLHSLTCKDCVRSTVKETVKCPTLKQAESYMKGLLRDYDAECLIRFIIYTGEEHE